MYMYICINVFMHKCIMHICVLYDYMYIMCKFWNRNLLCIPGS